MILQLFCLPYSFVNCYNLLITKSSYFPFENPSSFFNIKLISAKKPPNSRGSEHTSNSQFSGVIRALWGFFFDVVLSSIKNRWVKISLFFIIASCSKVLFAKYKINHRLMYTLFVNCFAIQIMQIQKMIRKN